jgi:hypothetical protein
MILPKNNQKSYGVLHTENYFSFTGFCKKVNSDEIQSIDIYLDDVLIDTILADKKLQNIEDIYDIEGFGFTYDLDEKYIGQKSLISFRNHESKENLQNSPYELLNTAHPKFNEYRFLHSLSLPINEEKIRDMYCPNSIGFLATEENLEDTEFVGYINELMVRFPNVEFKAFCFRKDTKQLSKNLFPNKQIQYIIPENIYDVASNIEVYLSNVKSLLDGNLFYKLRINIKYLYCVWINLDLQKTTIQKYELTIKSALDQFMNQYKELGFFDDEISEDNSYTKSFQYAISTRFMLGEKTIDINKSAYEYFNFKLIEYALGNTLYKEFFYYQVLGQYKILYGNKK